MLTNIKKFKKNTASPTNIYFADYNGTEKVVMKIYVDITPGQKVYLNYFNNLEKKFNIPVDIVNRSKNIYDRYKESIDGLEYEKEIYSRVIKKIIEDKYSPNFVEYVDFISYDIVDFLDLINPSEPMSDKKLVDFIKEIEHLDEITCIKNNNPGLIDHILSNFTVECIITREPINVTTMYDMFKQNILNNKEIYKIIFQLIYNLNLMDKIELQHNDLHVGNILIERLDKPIELYYIVGVNTFKISTKYIIRIFDWDYSYMNKGRLYLNNKIEKDASFWASKGIRNEFIRGFDLYTVFCLLNQMCEKDINNSLCTSEIMRNLFIESTSNGLMDIDDSINPYYVNTMDIGGEFIYDDSLSANCRPNIRESLNELEHVETILLSPLFDWMKFTSKIPQSKYVYQLSNLNVFDNI